jgi:hypothetical protein
VVDACVDLLGWRGYYVIRLQSGLFKTLDGRFQTVGKRGLPDFAAIHERYPGFLMETKRPGAKPSEDQIKRIEEIRIGFRVAVAVIDSPEALIDWLAEHERGSCIPDSLALSQPKH